MSKYRKIVIAIGIISILGSLVYLYFCSRFIVTLFKTKFYIEGLRIAMKGTGYTVSLFLVGMGFTIVYNLLLFISSIGLLKLYETARKTVVLCLIFGICWEIVEFVFIEKRMILEDWIQCLYLIFSLMILSNSNIKKIFLKENSH